MRILNILFFVSILLNSTAECNIKKLRDEYEIAKTKYSDIYEHIPTLRNLSSECTHITEFGVRSCVSTWAFLSGLYENGLEEKNLVSCDIAIHDNIVKVDTVAKNCGINFQFIHDNDLEILISTTDLLFIDTFHVYGQLKRELHQHSNQVRKYIVLHDTTSYGEFGEPCDLQQTAIQTGFSIEELKLGLWPAVEEFLNEHPEWILRKRYTNNNGLTILSRISSSM